MHKGSTTSSSPSYIRDGNRICKLMVTYLQLPPLPAILAIRQYISMCHSSIRRPRPKRQAAQRLSQQRQRGQAGTEVPHEAGEHARQGRKVKDVGHLAQQREGSKWGRSMNAKHRRTVGQLEHCEMV